MAENADALASLWPVIVGGAIGTIGTAIGVIGSLISAKLSHRLSEDSQRRKRSAEKLQELLELVHLHADWLEQQREKYAFGQDRQTAPSPLPKAIAIAAIDFPQFSKEIDTLDALATTYQRWIMQAGQKRLVGQVATMNDGFEGAYKPYLDQLELITRTIVSFGTDNFAAPLAPSKGKNAAK